MVRRALRPMAGPWGAHTPGGGRRLGEPQTSTLPKYSSIHAVARSGPYTLHNAIYHCTRLLVVPAKLCNPLPFRPRPFRGLLPHPMIHELPSAEARVHAHPLAPLVFVLSLLAAIEVIESLTEGIIERAHALSGA